MNASVPIQAAAPAAAANRRSAQGGADLLLVAGIVMLVNLPLLAGRSIEPMIFLPAAVAQGEWWRVLTFPFAHVSLYHLALDAGAFLMLYHGMRDVGSPRRAAIAATAAAGSLAAAFLSTGFGERGLCGLSGPAHGLMAATGLELIRSGADRGLRRVGWISLALVTGKSAVEAATGSVFLADLHFGNVGAPVALCHLGGVAGGALAWAAGTLAGRGTASRNTGGGPNAHAKA